MAGRAVPRAPWSAAGRWLLLLSPAADLACGQSCRWGGACPKDGGTRSLPEGWVPGPVADAHLAHRADIWLYDLLSDDSPFSWWYHDTVDAGVTDLSAWLSGPGAARLHAAGECDLATRAELLGLPHGERWDHHP
ncbi:hypothetical protein [Streptomyces sp. SD31]|uniref:hypothetical protein n=1 Tax=Streptomyces sp. SD31 TaxID=3452208 RepID=UPI003F899BFF